MNFVNRLNNNSKGDYKKSMIKNKKKCKMPLMKKLKNGCSKKCLWN